MHRRTAFTDCRDNTVVYLSLECTAGVEMSSGGGRKRFFFFEFLSF